MYSLSLGPITIEEIGADINIDQIQLIEILSMMELEGLRVVVRRYYRKEFSQWKNGTPEREDNHVFNAKLRKNAIDNYNAAVERYEKVANDLGENTNVLYKEREKALKLVKLIEERINQLANTPKEKRDAITNSWPHLVLIYGMLCLLDVKKENNVSDIWRAEADSILGDDVTNPTNTYGETMTIYEKI